MTSRSARAVSLRRTASATLLALVLLSLLPAAPVGAEETPSPPVAATPSPAVPPSPAVTPNSTVAPSPNPTTTMGATATTLAGLSAPVRDLSTAGTVREIITTLESIDGTETQKDTPTERTLILDSKVLFPEDEATLSSAARKRLRSVAGQITASSATGTVRVDGYTDDQGSAKSGLVLSRERAAAVRDVLAPLLAGSQVQITTRGLGEADPRFPNADKAGRPIPANQAKNRRVEITFTPQG